MNPDNYGSLPACKKLAEVLAKKGIMLETEVYWYRDTFDWYLGLASTVTGPYTLVHIPAPSMAEVWRELPDFVPVKDKRHHISIDRQDGNLRACYANISGSNMVNVNPTDALIELWIWVLEQEEGK